MAISSKKSSFNKILILVFGVAFGLVALAFAYQAAITSTDIRSRAAQTNQIYKQWEFNGSDTEGWKAVSPYTAAVKRGIFVLSGPKSSTLPAFRNMSVSATLPQGLKSISLSMAVGQVKLPTPTTNVCPKPPVCNGELVQGVADTGGCPLYKCIIGGPAGGSVGNVNTVQTVQVVSDQTDDATFTRTVSTNIACTLEARICPDGSSVGRSGNGCSFLPCPGRGQRKFVAQLYYKLVSRNTYERPIQFSGLADGSFRTYTVNLPNAKSISIDSIRVVLTSGIKSGETVGVDWIRILGPVVKPTPTPVSCSPNGSMCTITDCPPMPTCPPRTVCPQVMQTCTISQGICQNNRCVPSYPTPSCTMPPKCAYDNPPCTYAVQGVTYCPIKPTPTPTPIGKNICTGAKDGTPCVDTCASACPPSAQICTMQCTTRNGFCMNQRCETWLTPTPTPAYPITTIKPI